IDAFGIYRPSTDQCALKHLMKLTLKIVSIFEGAGLALVPINGHQPWARIRFHNLPFAAGGETSAAAAPSIHFGQFLNDGVDASLSLATTLEQLIAAPRPIFPKRFVMRDLRRVVAIFDHLLDRFRSGMVDMEMSNLANRGSVASPHAGGSHDSHLCRIGT